MRKIIKFLLVLFFGYIAFYTGITIYETIEVKSQIKQFTSRGELREDISTDSIKYWEVPRETSQDYVEPFYAGNIKHPGAEGDIFVTRQSPLVGYPIFYDLASFYFGGHAGYVGKNNEIYEVSGFPGPSESYFKVLFKGGENTYVKTKDNYWLNNEYRYPDSYAYKKFGKYYRNEWIGLRMNDATSDDIKSATNYMNDLVERKVIYNHFYIFFTKTRVYCTDMMYNAYDTITNSNGEKKYNLNMDRLAVTVNDLILSKDTHISYYFNVDKDGVAHFYYLV